MYICIALKASDFIIGYSKGIISFARNNLTCAVINEYTAVACQVCNVMHRRINKKAPL
jgi:hypothetical protein